MQEVWPGAGRVVGVSANGSYITLPADLFKHISNPGDCNDYICPNTY